MQDPRTEALLKKYVKMSQVKARPMSKHEYMCLSDDDDVDEPGFIVVTSDVFGNFNGPEHGGGWTVMWLSEETFKTCYLPLSNLNFGTAMSMLHKGHDIARVIWGWNEYLVFVNGQDCASIHDKLYPISPWIGLHRVDNTITPYSPSQEDLVSNDWLVVDRTFTNWKELEDFDKRKKVL